MTAEELRSAAWTAHHQGDLTGAERLYRELLASDADVQDAINLGALLRAQGRLGEATEHYHRWLERFPQSITLRRNGVNCLLERGDYETCRNWLETGLHLHPEHPQLLHGLAKAQIGLKHLVQAQQLLERLCGFTPGDAGLWLDLGLCRHGQENLEGALEAFEQAGKLSPHDARPVANCITVLKELGQLERAHGLIDSLPTALRRERDVQAAVGALYLQGARVEEAAHVLETLCRDHPQDPIHWLNWAASLRSLKNLVACSRALKRGLALHPQHPDLEQALGQSLAEMGKQNAAMELLMRSGGQVDQLPDSYVFNLQFLGAGYGLLSSERRQAMARSWESRKRSLGVGPLWGDVVRERLSGRPLRVGYLSADLCNHPVGRFLLPVLENHDRRAVEVWGLSCGPHQDGLKDRLEKACDHWLDLRRGGELEAARLIADQGLDVMVELGGFTDQSRLALLAQRPAPLQLSYLGFYAPTYLEAVDGWIGDETLFSTLNHCDREAHRLLSVHGGYMAFSCEALPELEAPLGARRFRFGSFNHSRKLTEATVVLWCAVLAAIPEADLVLKSISFVEPAERERVRDLFVRAGLANDRLVLLPWVEGWANHMTCYREIDVALDPVPYGGATTSCEALAMGVPVVSLAGPGMVGCLSASVLAHGAGGEGLVHSTEAFIEQAKALAQREPRGTRERQTVRQRLLDSPLADGPRLARELERLYGELARAAPRR